MKCCRCGVEMHEVITRKQYRVIRDKADAISRSFRFSESARWWLMKCISHMKSC